MELPSRREVRAIGNSYLLTKQNLCSGPRVVGRALLAPRRTGKMEENESTTQPVLPKDHQGIDRRRSQGESPVDPKGEQEEIGNL